MASVLAEPTLITGEALLTMSNIGPCELVKGRIVPMTPPGNDHGIVQALLIWYLQTFVIPRKLGWVTGGEAGVYTHRNPDSVRGMDVAFISYVRQPARPRGYLRSAPELIVEILSPSDRWHNVQEKLEEYFGIGVDRVWIVDPANHTVSIYRSATEFNKLKHHDIIQGEGILADFSLPLAELFDEN